MKISTIKTIIIVFLSLLSYLLYKRPFNKEKTQFFTQNFDNNNQNYSNIIKGVKLEKSTFESHTNYPELIKLLYKIKNNPSDKNKLALDVQIQTINKDIISHLCKVYGYNSNQRSLLLTTYDKFHRADNEHLVEKYYSSLIALNKNVEIFGNSETTSIIKKPIIIYDSYTSASNFSKVMSIMTCNTFDLLFGMIRMNPELAFAGNMFGMSCDIFLEDILKPLDDDLKSNAIVLDYHLSQTTIKKHLRETVSKLITVEDKVSSEVTEKIAKRFLNLPYTWIDISFDVESRIAAGVDLNEHYSFKVDATNKKVIITLAQPKVQIVDTTHKFNTLDAGWASEITPSIVNSLLTKGRKLNIQQAYKTDIILKAKQNTVTVFKTYIEPLLIHPAGLFELVVNFKEDSNDDTLQ